MAAVFCLASASLVPILFMESLGRSGPSSHVSVENLLHVAESLRHPLSGVKVQKPSKQAPADAVVKGEPPKERTPQVPVKQIANLLRQQTQPDTEFRTKAVARGVAGRPMDQTPAVVGAQRAHIECDVNVDSLAYWNDPQSPRDQAFVSPFAAEGDEKYISFSPDPGGWNNIRMSMEIIFVIAAATGRTLVLPPKEPLYLLRHAKKGDLRHRGFADFYPLQGVEFQKRVKVISMQDFLAKEGAKDGRLPIPEANRSLVESAAEYCNKAGNAEHSCTPLYEYLDSVGYVPQISSEGNCLVFDMDAYQGQTPPIEIREQLAIECEKKRQITYWDAEYKDRVLIHFKAGTRETRLLTHFYAMLKFTDPAIDHYYKRFVRDFLHYHDSIYCAAGKIVKALQVEGRWRNRMPDDNGAGGFSALHVRRGDLQYKRVKIPAEEWYENTKEVWQPGEILYIATDERNKTFFEPLAKHHDLRFLDDYWEYAGLGELDGNYMGMIDTIVASRGRAFAGTFFSTFSGFINRMRGYHGLNMKDSWYSFLDKKTIMHEWPLVDEPKYSFEWPDGWVAIDTDTWPERNTSVF